MISTKLVSGASVKDTETVQASLAVPSQSRRMPLIQLKLLPVSYWPAPQVRILLFFTPPVETLLIIPVVLPSGITRALNIARVASNWMFGFFITATILTFLCMILTPFSIPSSAAILSAPNYSSYYRAKKRAAPSKIAIPIAILAWGAWFTTSAGAAVATVMFVIFQIVFENNAADLNVHAELGIAMMALMWIPVALVTIGFLLQLRKLTGSCRNCCYYCCCCCLFPSARKAHDKSKITR